MVRILETLTGRRTEIVEVGNELAEIRELLAQALDAAAIVGRPGYSVVTADGITATFALPFSVANKNYVFAFVDSDYQHPDEVTLSEDRLSITLGFTPPAGARVVLRCTTSEIEMVEGVDSENVFIDGLGTLNTYIAQSEPQLQGYASRAAFEAATVPAPVMRWFVQQGKHTLRYVRDASGTAIESANGVKGAPDGDATPDHYGWTAILSTAEQTAICTTCLEAGHPVVRFLPGNTYLVDFVDAEITAPITVHIDGATIKGAAYTPVGDENDPNVIRINGTTPTRHSVRVTGRGVIDATLRRDEPGEASGSGLLVRYSNGVQIDGGIFFNSGTSATSGFGDSGVVIEYCRRTVIDGCFFRGWNDHGIYGTGGAEGNSAQVSSDLIVTNCVFEQIGAGAVRAARDYRRITVTNNHVVNSSKIFVAAGGTSNPDSGTLYNISNNIGIALFSAPIDMRYSRGQDGSVVSGNIIQGWATTTGMPAINIRGVSNIAVFGNVIVPGDLVQSASTTSCTLGIYSTGATNPLDDVYYSANNVQIYGNTITVFDRSGDAVPPENNVAILDLTNTARIWGNRLTNGEGFDIRTGDGVVGNPLVQRFSSLGVGFGGAYAQAALEVAGEARVSRIENADQYITLGTIGTIPSISSRSPVDNAKKLSFRSTTTLANDPLTGGELGFLFYIRDALRLSIDDTAIRASVPVQLPNYALGSLPDPVGAGAGATAYTPDGADGPALAMSDGTAWGFLASRDVAVPFNGRAAFEAATIPAGLRSWSVIHPAAPAASARVYHYRADSTGTAIESANGVKGSPANEPWVEHWGALGDGSADNAAAINAAMAWVTSKGGGTLRVGGGRYNVGSTITLTNDVELAGIGWETTEVYSTGDFPVFSYYGTISTTLRRVTVRDMMVGGVTMANTNGHGFDVVWTNKLRLENIQFRTLRWCIQMQYCIDFMPTNVVSDGVADSFYGGMRFREIDSALGIIDQTCTMTNVYFKRVTHAGYRVEGCTGMKAINCVSTNGDYGWYFGDAPLGADARVVRFLHLTNCFADTNNLAGWKFDQGDMSKIRDLKMVNCWSGSNSDTLEGRCIDMNGVEHSVISGGVYTYAKTNILRMQNCNDVSVDGCEFYQHDWAGGGSDSALVQASERVTFANVSASPLVAGDGTAGIRFEDCDYCGVTGGHMSDVVGVELHNTTRTTVMGLTVESTLAPVVETGTSNFNTVSGCISPQQPVLTGQYSIMSGNNGTTNPRHTITGGDPAEPSIYMSTAANSGFYRNGTYGFGYSANGVEKLRVTEDKTYSSVPVQLPSHTTAGLPAAGLSGAGSLAYATDPTTAEGGPTAVINTGTAWEPLARRPYVEIKTPWYTPEMFGAVGDGVTDDTAAFTAMTAATGSNGHWKLKSRYFLSAEILLQGKSVLIEGITYSGNNFTGFNFGGTGRLRLLNSSGVRVEKVGMRGTATLTPEWELLHMVGSANAVFQGVGFVQTNAPLGRYARITEGSNRARFIDIQASGARGEYGFFQGGPMPSDTATGASIMDFDTFSIGALDDCDAFVFDGGSGSARFVNGAMNFGRRAIWAKSVGFVYFTNCGWENHSGDYTMRFDSAKNIQIANCYINGGIQLADLSNDIRITNNIIRAGQFHGIEAAGMQINIHGNTFIRNSVSDPDTFSGIKLTSAAKNATVTGNQFPHEWGYDEDTETFGQFSTPLQRYCIDTDMPVDRGMISGNYFEGYVTAPIGGTVPTGAHIFGNYVP